MKAASKIRKSNKFLDNNFFIEGEIRTLSKQRTEFDKALKNPTQKPKPATPSKPEPQTKPKPNNQPQPQPPKPANPNQSSSSQPMSKKMLQDLLEKRNIYFRSLYREGEDIYDIQSRFVEYEHQIRRTKTNMPQLFDLKYPKEQETEHQNAIMELYAELDVWEPIEIYNQKQGLTDFNNLDGVSIPEIQRDLGQIIKAKIPGDADRLMDQGKLQERGKSVMGEEHLPASMLQDQSFIRKKDQIRSLKSKNRKVIQKNPEERIPEEPPKINVRPSSEYEEEVKKIKDDQIKQIGEDEGDQVSQINVEEDSEIEYHMENLNGDA